MRSNNNIILFDNPISFFRCSIWHKDLSIDQIKYCGLDALASCEVAHELFKAIKILQIKPIPNQGVNLFDSSLKSLVATGKYADPTIPQVSVAKPKFLNILIKKIYVDGALVLGYPASSINGNIPSLGSLDAAKVNETTGGMFTDLVVPWPSRQVKIKIHIIENARLSRENLTQGEILLDIGVEALWYAAQIGVFFLIPFMVCNDYRKRY